MSGDKPTPTPTSDPTSDPTTAPGAIGADDQLKAAIYDWNNPIAKVSMVAFWEEGKGEE